ncbi:MAG TPA: GNAT family N-acetyltransferase [bacterium]|jgi:GNAT superfamily N-acetyltransferase
MRIEQLDIGKATDAQLTALNALTNETRLERFPDDPPVPLQEDMRRWRNIPPVITVGEWLAWDDGALVAEAHTEYLRTEENKHLLEFMIFVTKDRRRQGIGTKLLAEIARYAAAENRPTLFSFTFGSVPSGDAFMQRIGAEVGLETHTNQLDMKDLNRDLLPLWQQRAKERAVGFELVLWANGYPEDALEQLVQVWESMNRAPRGTLQMDDFHWTVDHIREFERSDRKRGNEVWSLVARERATGNLAGFTEVSWHPNRPELVQQRGTGVLPRYQNLGLGRWLKAAMLEKILLERPQVARVRTGNADSNAPMLKINRELGFKPYVPNWIWQVQLPQVQTYLNDQGFK